MKWLLASILALSVFITQAATAPKPRTDPYNTLATGTAWVYTTHGNGAVNLNTFILEFDNVTTVPSRSWHRDQENGLRAIGILSSNSSEALDTLTIYWVPEELINPSFDPEDMLDSIRAEPIMLEFYNFKRTGSKGRQSETRSILRTRCFMEFLGMKSPPVIPPVPPGFSPQHPPAM